MGPRKNLTRPQPERAGRKRPVRRPRTRQCLLKGCEQRFRPQQARQRYCSDQCRRGARKWSRWKAQQSYRATATGKEKRNGQSRRYRERVRNRKQPAPEEAVPDAARVITKDFFRPLLRSTRLLPGIRCSTPIAPPRFCSRACRRALERVRQREWRWRRSRCAAQARRGAPHSPGEFCREHNAGSLRLEFQSANV